MRRAVVLLPVVLAASACNLLNGGKDDDPNTEQVWTRFNADGDTIAVEVTEADVLGDPVTAKLHSSTGSVEIGDVVITPGSGPVGTVHTVQVFIDEGDTDDPWYDRVGKVEFDADAGDRGTWTITMDQDSADASLWEREIVSYGDAGEVRTDTFTFAVYELEEVPVDDIAVEE